MSDAPQLLVEQSDGIVRFTLNRAAKRNALSLSLLQEILSELKRVEQDATARVVILQASGPVFSSGHDLKEMVGRSTEEYQTLFETCSEMMLKLRQIPQPTIAAVHGLATAAGCQLVAACDLAVATESARFATPGVKIGLFCTTPMVPLVRSIPAKQAMEMLLTGQPISAQRAYEIGLINRVVVAEDLQSVVDEFAEAICQSSPMTIRLGKEAFYHQASLSEADAYEDAAEVMTENACKQDAQEGISAFLEKRAPQWTGN